LNIEDYVIANRKFWRCSK